MVGRDVVISLDRHKAGPARATGKPVLEAEDLTALSDRGVTALDKVSIRLEEGEILGVTGVDGNGQKELSEVIGGLRPLVSGTINVGGRDITDLSIKQRMTEAGIAFVPEDRQATGLVLDYSVALNMALRSYDRPPASRRGLLDFRAIQKRGAELAKRYDVRLRSVNQPARFLSGGNQQKVILAREIEAAPRLLVVMQACKGLDVGAIEFVQNTILELKSKGVAVLYIATELEHVLDVADRISVMYRGRITGTLARAEATTERIGELMAGIGSVEVA
jgi:simple sugar transport system ATP-binding protein